MHQTNASQSIGSCLPVSTFDREKQQAQDRQLTRIAERKRISEFEANTFSWEGLYCPPWGKFPLFGEPSSPRFFPPPLRVRIPKLGVYNASRLNEKDAHAPLSTYNEIRSLHFIGRAGTRHQSSSSSTLTCTSPPSPSTPPRETKSLHDQMYNDLLASHNSSCNPPWYPSSTSKFNVLASFAETQQQKKLKKDENESEFVFIVRPKSSSSSSSLGGENSIPASDRRALSIACNAPRPSLGDITGISRKKKGSKNINNDDGEVIGVGHLAFASPPPLRIGTSALLLDLKDGPKGVYVGTRQVTTYSLLPKEYTEFALETFPSAASSTAEDARTREQMTNTQRNCYNIMTSYSSVSLPFLPQRESIAATVTYEDVPKKYEDRGGRDMNGTTHGTLLHSSNDSSTSCVSFDTSRGSKNTRNRRSLATLLPPHDYAIPSSTLQTTASPSSKYVEINDETKSSSSKSFAHSKKSSSSLLPCFLPLGLHKGRVSLFGKVGPDASSYRISSSSLPTSSRSETAVKHKDSSSLYGKQLESLHTRKEALQSVLHSLRPFSSPSSTLSSTSSSSSTLSNSIHTLLASQAHDLPEHSIIVLSHPTEASQVLTSIQSALTNHDNHAREERKEGLFEHLRVTRAVDITTVMKPTEWEPLTRFTRPTTMPILSSPHSGCGSSNSSNANNTYLREGAGGGGGGVYPMLCAPVLKSQKLDKRDVARNEGCYL